MRHDPARDPVSDAMPACRATENFARGDRAGVGWVRVGVETQRSFRPHARDAHSGGIIVHSDRDEFFQ